MSLESKLAKYPKQKLEWRKGHNKARSIRCDGCGNSFPREDDVLVLETQVDFFRGNDEVEFLCVECAKERGHEPPPSKSQRKREHLQQEIAAHTKKIAEWERLLARRRKILAKATEELEGLE